MKAKTTVTIMIPAYNQETMIGQAISSALAQDYPYLEIIISDDGSTDGTPQAIKKYLRDGRVRYYRHENLGRVGNYHKTLNDYATGEYVLNLDGDDFLTDKSYISKAIGLITKHPDLVMVFARQRILIERTGKIIEEEVNSDLPTIMEGNWFFLKYPQGYSQPHLTTLYHRKKAIEAGFYTKNIISEDWESFFKLMIGNRMGFINEFVGNYRKHENNCTKLIDPQALKKNSGYIDSGYEHALRARIASKKELDEWRKNMMKRYLMKNVIRTVITHERQRAREVQAAIKNYFPDMYATVYHDPRLFLLRIFSRSDMVMRLVFKRILKIEGFYEDLKDSSLKEKNS